MPRWNPILGVWEGRAQSRCADPPPDPGWLRRVLKQAARDVATLSWIFGGVNPYAPTVPVPLVPTVEVPKLEHVCGLQGFGLGIHDICEVCEQNRLMKLGVPEDIACRAAWLRGGMNPDITASSELRKQCWEKFWALEKEYGRKIP